jgi:hypothetical protein
VKRPAGYLCALLGVLLAVSRPSLGEAKPPDASDPYPLAAAGQYSTRADAGNGI